jgi:hypothetical protein
MSDNVTTEAEFDPESSQAWLDLISDAEKALSDWQTRADKIDKIYADMSRAAAGGDRQFSLFWANLQVLAPSVYSRPPVPVVVPRFRSRDPIARASSEMLERVASVQFELDDVDSTMRLVRDDLVRVGRGVSWVRYEDKLKKGKKNERLCVEHVDRRDFIHSPARKWQEVDWVARRAWMSKEEMRKRFGKEKADDASYDEVKRDERDRGHRDPIEKAGVWEIWSKSEDRVVWVTEGVDTLLDSDDPFLTLDNFFPCPKPAYSTVQPGSLVPVPDYVYYQDQLAEINELTGRITALTSALQVKGFYPAGGETGDVIETALKLNDSQAIMVPVSNWAAFGSGGDNIIWLPIDQIANVIKMCVEIRKQLIDDVYQITGLSDIMRGLTNASETLGAQELKSQYGSVRIRDKQDELVRTARDLTRISAEIMAENFDRKTLMDMSQMDLPTDADIKKQVKELTDQQKEIANAAKKQIADAQKNPQIMAQAQANPEEAQAMLQQLQEQANQQIQQLGAQAQEIGETVTIDQVMELFKEQRLRPFILDIETDSTIAPDENAQKQRATEFITAVGGFLNQAISAIQVAPESAPLMADTLKYVASQFRAGRELDNSIDEFAEKMKERASQPQPNPEAEAAQAAQQIEQQRFAMEQQKEQREAESHQQDMMIKQELARADLENKRGLTEHEAALLDRKYGEEIQSIVVTRAQNQEKHAQEREKNALEIENKRLSNENLAIKGINDQVSANQQLVLNAETAAQKASEKKEAK